MIAHFYEVIKCISTNDNNAFYVLVTRTGVTRWARTLSSIICHRSVTSLVYV